MKVAIVSEWLDAWRGGAETSTLQFVHQLMDRGVEVHVFTRSRPSPAPGFHVHSVSGAAMSRTRASMTFTHRVERMVRKEEFDIVHAITPCRGADIFQPRGGTVAESIERNLALLESRFAQGLKKCGNVLNFKQRYQRRLERSIMGRADGPVVVAISDYVAQQLTKHYALPPERVRKIYNGVSPTPVSPAKRAADHASVRREYGISENQCVVIQVAHNFRLKGVHRWMEALAMLRERGVEDVRSLVIGKGDSDRWHREAARLRVADMLTFVGPTERIAQFYHAADVLVHPTYYDPCSRVVLEAMTAGLACITTRWDGASEMICDGENGFVLGEACDVAGLADAVMKLRDTAERNRLGANASLVAEQISMVRHAEEMLRLYGDVMAARKKGDARTERASTVEPSSSCV